MTLEEKYQLCNNGADCKFCESKCISYYKYLGAAEQRREDSDLIRYLTNKLH